MLKDYDFKVKIIRSNRRTTALHVVGDIVLVKTNLVTTDKIINELLEKHSTWIKKRIKINDKEELFLLLGREYEIKKIASDKYGYKFTDDTLVCYVSNEEDLMNIYDEIYCANQEILKEIIKSCVDNFMVKPKEIHIKRLRRAFGICHSNRKISINLYVLKYSRQFIEMVVYHELCHLLEMNHSEKFYEMLRQYSPNYKRIKKEARP